MAEQSNPFPLTIDLGDQNGSVCFRQPDAVQSWVQEEREIWSWLRGNAHATQMKGLNEFQQLWKAHKSGETGEEQFAQQLRNRLNLHFGQRGGVYSKGPYGKFTLELRERDADLATCALRYFQGAVEIGSTNGFQGSLEAALFASGFRGSARNERAAFRELSKEVRDARAEFERKLGDLVRSGEELEAKSKKLIAGHRKGFEELLSEFRQKWEELERHFHEKLGLRAPASYWRDKANAHRDNAVKMGWASGIGAGLVVIGLIVLAYYLLGEVRLGDPSSLFPIAVFLAFVTFGIWLVRILLRVFLSQTHLATDAAERRVMILTYLTLLDKGLEAKDREIILQALFRSSADGIVRDEGAPASVLELLGRMADRTR